MNELEYIRSLTMQRQPSPPGVMLGLGDDCAVIRKDSQRVQLLSMDTLVETVHFERRFHPPALLGRKVVSVNVSDIAAMGGTPLYVLLSSGLPPGFDASWMLAFNEGVLAACKDYGCALIGGDTVASPGGFSFTITIVGEMDAQAVLYRSGAQAGDTVFVSGQLGQAAGGLALLSAELADTRPIFAELTAKHLNPEARVQLGSRLAASGMVHAMMDSSDGLATDLAHICTASGLGAQIFSGRIPLAESLRHAARCCQADPLDWALRGGEDFELIFTAPARYEASLQKLAHDCSVQIHAIGVMDKGQGVRLVDGERGSQQETPLSFQGYDHFRNR